MTLENSKSASLSLDVNADDLTHLQQQDQQRDHQQPSVHAVFAEVNHLVKKLFHHYSTASVVDVSKAGPKLMPIIAGKQQQKQQEDGSENTAIHWQPMRARPEHQLQQRQAQIEQLGHQLEASKSKLEQFGVIHSSMFASGGDAGMMSIGNKTLEEGPPLVRLGTIKMPGCTKSDSTTVPSSASRRVVFHSLSEFNALHSVFVK